MKADVVYKAQSYAFRREIYSSFTPKGVTLNKRFQNLVGVSIDVDFVKNFFDLSLFVDQKSRAVDAHIGFAHKLFLAVNAVKIAHGVIGVGDQSHRQIVF